VDEEIKGVDFRFQHCCWRSLEEAISINTVRSPSSDQSAAISAVVFCFVKPQKTITNTIETAA